jgi:retron-type reverse transcriptase
MSLELTVRLEDHRGSHRAFIDAYSEEARTACESRYRAFEQFVRRLPHLISDERNLKAAFNHLVTVGGTAPGPDGISAADIPKSEHWPFVRRLRDELRCNKYTPGPIRECLVPKGIGSSGKRTIWVASFRDRIVARACSQLTRPILESFAHPTSFCRGRRGTSRALAFARHQILAEGRSTVLVEDLRNAFDRVPRARLLQVVGQVKSSVTSLGSW